MGDFKRKYIEKQRDLSQMDVRPPFPKIIKIDICNTCNYSCVFCPQSKQTGKLGNIDDTLCRNIIADAYKAGAREICLSSTGEPLLNKRLPEYIKFCKDIGYTYVFFNTNGFLLDEKMANTIIRMGIDSVKFSINAARDSYEVIHGAGSYDRVIENLRLFDKQRKELKSSCRLYVSYVSTKYTIDEEPIVKNDVGSFCDEMIVMKANNRGGVADEVDKELYSGQDEFSYHFPCSQIFNNVYVTAEGYMVACCQDFDNNMVVEDLKKTTVEDAWNGARFVEFRRNFLNKEFKDLLCDNCLYNKHNHIVPLRKEFAGYAISESKRLNLKERIEVLKKTKPVNMA